MSGERTSWRSRSLTREQEPGDGAENDFERFVRAERARLIASLQAYYGVSQLDAEEAVQAALIQAWRQWATIATSPRGWVIKVAVREYWRAQERRAGKPLSDETLQAGRTLPSAAELAVLNEQERQIFAYLAKLPPTQRLISVLRYQGLSNQQIADELGMKVSAVRQNVLRARSQLRHLRQASQEDAG